MISAPLIDLLKSRRCWIRSQICQQAFDALKKSITKERVLSLPDLEKPFKLHTDAFDFAISGVLMQDGHLVAFKSRKLNDTKKRHTVQEKEMTVVVHCPRT